jgi:uncharacterized protein (TIGR02118 family)
MEVCWFATFRGLGEVDIGGMEKILAATPGLSKALIFTPATTSDPYLNDGPSPSLALHLYFPGITAMEAALAPEGYLQALARPGMLAGIEQADVTQQAMLARVFPVDDPQFRTPAGALPCSYLVSYEGRAEDLNVWLSYYIAHHPPIMRRFPGIREIEIDTRIDWCGFLPWSRVDYMQRNKVVFDTEAALTAALNSPVRHEMRADFHRFPPFDGANTHFPMLTRTVRPG